MICALRRMLLAGAIAMASAPAPAWTEPAPPADKRQMAKQYVETGLAAQRAGDYDSAITLYEMAYNLVPHPVLLFDIGQAHRLAGRLAQALEAYKRYIAEDPAGAEAQTARELIVELEAKLATPAASSDAPRRAPETGPPRPPERAAPEQRRSMTAGSISGGSISDGSAGRALRVAGVATGSVGVAALLVGTGFGWRARSLSNELSGTGALYDRHKEDDGKRANKIAITGFVAGGVLAATGAALYLWGHQRGRAPEQPVIAPVVSARSAGLAITGGW